LSRLRTERRVCAELQGRRDSESRMDKDGSMQTADTHIIDLRSDTVTRPSAGMLKAMAEAEVGDDVYGDDPTVNRLEAYAAEITNHEAAVFAPTGTQTNLLALLVHCQRGDEYLVAQEAHTYRFEGGGAAVLGSIQPQPIHQQPDGTIDLALAKTYIKPDDHHFARTKLLALEDTTNGKVLPLPYLAEARRFADGNGLALHLDGARAFNAAVADHVAISEITEHFDTVSLCLSKGLGAPVGSLLVGSRAHIAEARKWRKMLGGGMRQAGYLAAAGLYALQHNVDRLAEDHANAARLADGLRPLPNVTVLSQATNMVFISCHDPERFSTFMKSHDVRLASTYGTLRLVCHLDLTSDDVERFLQLAARAV
jgi:threonine aldolase